MSEENKSTKKKHRKGISTKEVPNHVSRNAPIKESGKFSSKSDRRTTDQNKSNSTGRKIDNSNQTGYGRNDKYEDFNEDLMNSFRIVRTKNNGLELRTGKEKGQLQDNKKRNDTLKNNTGKLTTPKETSFHKRVNEENNQDRSKSGVKGISKNTSRDQKYNTKEQNRKNNGSQEVKPGKRDNKRAFLEQGKCPYIKECGSCRMMQVDYKEHLKEKQNTVNGLISKFCKVEPIIGMKDPKHYRNKVHVVFDHDRRGNAISGIYEEGTHRVIPIDRCLIHNEKADEIINSIRGLLKSFKIKTYDEDTEYGLLRHVLIRTGFASGEIMVVLVLASPILPSKNNFVKALRKLHPEITTIVINVNDKKTSMVLGEKEQVIYGKGYIEDSLCGKVFRISPKSFYQVNPAQTEVIYGKAIELANLKGDETVIDAYCGIGTIGIIASDHVGKVIGVELNKDAVRDAVNNAKRNQITNVEFYNQDAGEFMRQLAEQKVPVDIVFMDPPRAGSDEMFLDSVIALKPKKVVYISCNPVTLERDLLYLSKKGYKAEKAIPVDMFPWTAHVETCCLLSKKA